MASILSLPPAGAFDPSDITLTDDTSGAFLVKEGSNEYVRINTTNGSELVRISSPGSSATSGIFFNVPAVGDAFYVQRTGGTPATKIVSDTGVTLFQVDSSQILADLIASNKTFKVDGTPGTTPLTIQGDGETIFTLDETADSRFRIMGNGAVSGGSSGAMTYLDIQSKNNNSASGEYIKLGLEPEAGGRFFELTPSTAKLYCQNAKLDLTTAAATFTLYDDFTVQQYQSGKRIFVAEDAQNNHEAFTIDKTSDSTFNLFDINSGVTYAPAGGSDLKVTRRHSSGTADVMTLKGDTDFSYILKYDSSGTQAGGDAVENNFTIGTDRTGGSANLFEVTTRKVGLGEGEGVFFAGPITSQVWVSGPSTFRVQSAEIIHNPSSGKNNTTSLQGTSAFRVHQTTGDSIMNIAADSNTTFTLEDASSAVFKIVDDDSSPRTYFTATENGVVEVDGVKVGLGGGRIADNVAVGTDAFAATQNMFGNSVAVGFEAGKAQVGGYNNTFLGFKTGLATVNSIDNTAVGFACMDGTNGANVLTGSENTGLGSSACRNITSGSGNVGLGRNALNLCTTGADNVTIGTGAGDAIVGGTGNIAIGHESDCDAAGINQIAIGNGVVVAGTNNLAAIGNSSNAATLNFGSTGQSWSTTSDVRIKENIQDGDIGLAFINSLRPVKHTAKDPAQWPEEIRPADPSEITPEQREAVKDGLIAQEVKAAADALGTSFSGWEQDANGLNRLQYERFVVPLIKAVQELSAQVEELKGKK